MSRAANTGGGAGAEPDEGDGEHYEAAERAARDELDGQQEHAARDELESQAELEAHEELDEDGEGEEEDEEGLESVTIEITGLSLYTHHGASDAEREVGQRLLLDLRLDLGEADATATDRLEDTVDYAAVCQLVALVSQQRSHRTLERLCATIAERLLSEYELEGVWVKASKPEPPMPLAVESVSVEVWQEAQ
jgi:7,8-dihydroneopterin aldolase/epimerase/oxygenase